MVEALSEERDSIEIMNSSSGDPNLPFAINQVCFNARGDHFVVAATNSFQIYKTEPLELINSTPVPGGIKTIELLNQG